MLQMADINSALRTAIMATVVNSSTSASEERFGDPSAFGLRCVKAIKITLASIGKRKLLLNSCNRIGSVNLTTHIEVGYILVDA